MSESALERKLVVCFATLIAAALPILFTACGGGSTAPASGNQQKATPVITSVVPDTAPPTGGKVVMITGSNLTADGQSTPPSVTFGGVAATKVSIVSPTQVSATTPPHDAGDVTVQVTNPNGESATAAEPFTYTTSSLTLGSVSPISGPAAGGTQVTITGTNFQAGVGVTFGGLAATSVEVTSSTTIEATTPAHTAGDIGVTVTNSDGQSATLSSGYAYHSVSLSWSAPSSSTVTITGYDVYRSPASAGPYSKLNSTQVTSTLYTDPTVQGSTTYYYEVTSVASSGAESSPDGPVETTTPP